MSTLVDALSWILLLTGAAFVLIGGVGLIRLPNFFTRLHAASVTDTAGVMSIALGLMLQAGFSQATVKLLLIVLFMIFTGPAATHALAKAALHGKLKPSLATQRDGRESEQEEAGPSNT